VTVNFRSPAMEINETFAGDDADEIVGAMKSRIAKNSPFAMRLLIGGMSKAMFMQEVVNRYNDYANKPLTMPDSSEEFLELMQREGIAAIFS